MVPSSVCYPATLTVSLSQVDMAIESQRDKFSALSFSAEDKDVALVANPWDPVSDFWIRQPSELHLHIFVVPPARGVMFYVRTALDRLSRFLLTWIPLSAFCTSLQLTSHSFYLHFYSCTIGFRPAPLSTIALNSNYPKTLQGAQRLHAAMWKLPLKPRLKDISDRSGKVLKYVPATHIRDLELRHLGSLRTFF